MSITSRRLQGNIYKVMHLRLTIATAVPFAPGGRAQNRNQDATLRALPELSIVFVMRTLGDDGVTRNVSPMYTSRRTEISRLNALETIRSLTAPLG